MQVNGIDRHVGQSILNLKAKDKKDKDKEEDKVKFEKQGEKQEVPKKEEEGTTTKVMSCSDGTRMLVIYKGNKVISKFSMGQAINEIDAAIDIDKENADVENTGNEC